MKLSSLLSRLRSGMFKVLNCSSDSLIAFGDVTYNGYSPSLSFSDCSADLKILLDSLVSEIWVCDGECISIYVNLEDK